MDTPPRLAYDLVEALDQQEKHPLFPQTVTHAQGLDEGQVRRGIWHAARRALVNELIAMYNEDIEDAEGTGVTEGDGLRSVLDTPVLDPSGQPHQGVAPVHLAPARFATHQDGGS